jgi:hypothetical protein
MIKVIKNTLIGEVRIVEFSDGSFELHYDGIMMGLPIQLSPKQAKELSEFLKPTFFGQVSSPVSVCR